MSRNSEKKHKHRRHFLELHEVGHVNDCREKARVYILRRWGTCYWGHIMSLVSPTKLSKVRYEKQSGRRHTFFRCPLIVSQMVWLSLQNHASGVVDRWVWAESRCQVDEGRPHRHYNPKGSPTMEMRGRQPRRGRLYANAKNLQEVASWMKDYVITEGPAF